MLPSISLLYLNNNLNLVFLFHVFIFVLYKPVATYGEPQTAAWTPWLLTLYLQFHCIPSITYHIHILDILIIYNCSIFENQTLPLLPTLTTISQPRDFSTVFCGPWRGLWKVTGKKLVGSQGSILLQFYF